MTSPTAPFNGLRSTYRSENGAHTALLPVATGIRFDLLDVEACCSSMPHHHTHWVTRRGRYANDSVRPSTLSDSRGMLLLLRHVAVAGTQRVRLWSRVCAVIPHPRVLSILGTSDFTWLPGTCAAFVSAALICCALRRKDVLPVINKRWAHLLRGCSPAWRVAKITHTYTHIEDEDESEDDSEEPLSSAAVLGWFNSRPG